MRKILSFIVAVFFTTSMFAQTTVKGTVVDANSQPIPGVSVKIADMAIGTVTDFDGNYVLKTDESPVFTIEFISMGFTTQTAEVTSKKQTINITMEESTEMLDEVVMSASRTPERIMETPVTIERMGLAEIKNTSSANFYEGLENMKGVQMNKNSLTFQSVNTRGFATFANTRFVQLIDGMDNSSPALGFTLGNLVGISELDVQSVEILPGASSALYGANAFNGILFMNSKNPFDHEGISAYVKGGITSQKAAGDNPLYDVGVRYAKAGEKFAFKFNASVLQGEDWHANDYSNKGAGSVSDDRTNPAYEGVNVYGDEVATVPLPSGYNIQQVTYGALAGAIGAANAAEIASTVPVQSFYISRTGYNEEDLLDNKASTIKADVGLYFRPKGKDDDFEVSLIGRYGLGNTIYQGLNRYALRDLMMSQVKLEVKDKNYFLRAYTTIEDAGNSYDAIFTGWNVNRQWKSDTDWFTEYTGGYIRSYAGLHGTAASPGPLYGNPDLANTMAHEIARKGNATFGIAGADSGRLIPGTAAFDAALATVTSDPDFRTGSKFIDKSQTFHTEGNYNFDSMLNNLFELQVGGSYRAYSLNSEGTIFTDYDGAIKYGEYAAYAQLGKKMFDDRLKLRVSLRMDKQDNFDANLSPRISGVYSAGERKQHNFRASFQTGFRNPTTQDLYIGLDLGPITLVGASPANMDRFTSLLGSGNSVTANDAYFNSYTLESVQAFKASGQVSDLVKAEYDLVKAEEVKAYEIGYRGKIGKLNIDLNWFKNTYNNFSSGARVVTPGSGSVDDMSGVIGLITPNNTKVFQIYTNAKGEVSSQGFGLGLSTKVGNDFNIGFSWDRNTLKSDEVSNSGIRLGFNTPKNAYKFSFGKSNADQKVGFKVDYKWQDAYFYESSFADSQLESRVVMDAQVSYKIPAYKTTLKLGGSNIFGDEYSPAIGSGRIGSIYYLSLTYNN